MHILVLPSFYPSPIRPHTGIFFRDQVEALRRRGHQVGVLVAPRIRETIDHIRRERHLPDLRTAVLEERAVYRMHWGWFPRIFPRICALLTGPAGLRAFERYCTEQGRPDVIHAHNIFYSGYMAIKIKEKYALPVVLTEHSSNFIRGRIFLPGQHQIARQTLHQADKTLTVGPSLAQALLHYDKKTDIEVIGNIVNTEFFTPSDSIPPRSPFIFATVTSLIPVKRIALMIEAFSMAFRGDPAVQLKIGGGGGGRKRLERLADKEGIPSQVTFLGRLDREGVRALYHEAHTVVSSSAVETFGLILAEAMSCGKPVIATRSGGPQSFVTEKTGLLVPTEDRAALAEAMHQMRDHYENYSPAEIRAACVDRFSEGVIISRMEAIYQQIFSQST